MAPDWGNLSDPPARTSSALVGPGVLAAANLKASPGISPGLPCLRVHQCRPGLCAQAWSWEGRSSERTAVGCGDGAEDGIRGLHGQECSWGNTVCLGQEAPLWRGAQGVGLPTHQPAPPSAPGVVPTRATLPQAAATACWSAPRLWRPYPSRAWLGVPQTVPAFPPSHSGREQIPEGGIKAKAEHQGWLSEGRGMEISPCVGKSRGLNLCDLIHRLGQSCVCGISEQMGIPAPEMDRASAAADFGNNYATTWIKSESELTPQWLQMVQGPT